MKSMTPVHGTGAAALVAAGLCLWPSPSQAHHSFAMFDAGRQTALTGTVREFQFTNPHCFIQLLVPGKSPPAVEWSIEMGPPVALKRNGWTKQTLQPGEKVTVLFHPLKNGTSGGSFVSALDAGGHKI